MVQAIILAALSPAERMAALDPAGRVASVGERIGALDPLLSWTVWLPVLLAGAAGALLITAYRRWYDWHQSLRAFEETAGRLALSGEERGVLARLAAAARVDRINEVLLAEAKFEHGVEQLRTSSQVRALSEAGRQHLEAVVGALRAKLGFTPLAADGSQAVSKGGLAPGARVSVVRQDAPEVLQATVIQVGDTRLVVDVPLPPDAPLGEAWRLRHISEGQQWEFDCAVVDIRERRVTLKLLGEPRCINLRRFARVPIHRPACLALFPFAAEAGPDDTPAFVASTLTEIAGTGLRIDSPLRTAVGDRVLVIVRTSDERRIQGVGIVRRAVAGSSGVFVTVAEMTGLASAEISELVRLTNQAAHQANVEPEESETEAVPAPAGGDIA